MTDMPEPEVPLEIVERLRARCVHLPEVQEEAAWVGTRWRVRGRTFAHVLVIADGWPPAYARAGTGGPACVLMVRASGPELEVLRSTGAPFFAPPWRADEIGLRLEGEVDWEEIAELVTESYCTVAPKRLRDALDRPGA